MACILVPAVEAVVVTAVACAIKFREKRKDRITDNYDHSSSFTDTVKELKISFSVKLMWLAHLLWGGAFLLAFEHIWHGEIVPWFPFLTAASNPEDAAQMLHEISTVGVSMAVLVTLVWVGIVLVANSLAKSTLKHNATLA